MSASATSHLTALETAALILSLFFVGVSIGGSSPLVSALLEDRGFSEYFTGGVVAMLSLGLALFSPLAGRLVERHGPRPINVIGILLSGIGLGALHLALLWDERMLFGVRLSLGAADALTFVAAEYALLRGTPESRRARVMAAYTAGFGLGFMGGVFVSNPLYDTFGLPVFWVFTAAAAAIAPIAHWGLRNMKVEARAHHETTTPKATAWPGLSVVFYGAVVYAVLDVAMSGTYPVEGQRLGLSRAETLRFVGFMALGSVLIQPAAGWLADRFGNLRLIYAFSLLGFLAAVAAGYVSATWPPEQAMLALASFTLIGCAAGGIFPLSLALLGERTPVPELSRANAAFTLVFGYASLVAPLVAAGFIDASERLDLLGWAVPALAGLSFAISLPCAWLDARWRRSSKTYLVEENHSAIAVETKEDRDECS